MPQLPGGGTRALSRDQPACAGAPAPPLHFPSASEALSLFCTGGRVQDDVDIARKIDRGFSIGTTLSLEIRSVEAVTGKKVRPNPVYPSLPFVSTDPTSSPSFLFLPW